MKAFKKIGALVLAGAMVLGMSSMAFADTNLGSNEDGVAGEFYGGVGVDNPTVQDKTVNIVKQIISINANSTTVNAPVVTYTYTVTPASVSGLTVQDQTQDHAASVAVTVPVKEGLTTGLTVNGGNAGTASQAVGTLTFTNTSTWNSSNDGTNTGVNPYNIALNFSNVSFTQPGVYRYQIVETSATTGDEAIAKAGMAAGSSKTRYLDLYVKGTDSDSDGSLDIYGYVCMEANDSVTPSTTKTNGFVSDSNGADTYYTYDLTLDKDVVGDTYAETNHAFPFTVTFSNPESYTSTFTITETAAAGSTGISPTVASAPIWTGTATVKDGATITYTGIPAGVDVAVYETNDLVGLTYTVESKVNGTTAHTDNAVVGNTGTSTSVSVDTTTLVAPTATQTVQIVNTLLTISPTGVVLRVAPYALMLAAGIVLLLIARRRKSVAEEA